MFARSSWILHAKSLLAAPRAYVAARQRARGHGTQAERWAKPESFHPDWDERTALMAAMVAPGSSVLEFGAGRERLRGFLPAGCHYQPSDIVARSPQTLVADLNAALPALPQRYDVILLSGVLEYIHDLPRLFAYLRPHGARCIASYATTDALDCMATRLGDGWVSHVSEATLLAIATHAGFTLRARTAWRQQTIYDLG